MNKVFLASTILISSFGLSAQPDWQYDLKQAQFAALNQGKLLLVDFTAEWCGPCKAMDRSVWNDQRIDSLSEKYISVKIDISNNPGTAQEFGVNAIPRVLILDASKSALGDHMGYQGVGQLSSMISPFPANVSIINQSLVGVMTNPKDQLSHYNTAMAYQRYLVVLDGMAKASFFNQSSLHFDKARKLAKKRNDDILEEKAILGNFISLADIGKPEKAIDDLHKYDEEDFSDSNRAYYNYVLAYAYMKAENESLYQNQTAKLSELPGGKHFIKMLEARRN